jgi:N-acetyl sugar amidotransferase
MLTQNYHPNHSLVVCTKCVLDSTVPNVIFDNYGVCNYCEMHDRLAADYPKGSDGLREFDQLVMRMKTAGQRKEYDCVVGVSGGTDSTYLLWVCKQYGLRVLAVNIDNGWNSKIAVANIKSALSILEYDLYTYVIDWEEMRSIHLSFLRERLPWPDGATDVAIGEGLYRVARKFKIKYVLNGHDFRTEGKQPTPWTWVDGRMIAHVASNYGIKIRTFPNQTLFSLIYNGFISGIKDVRPFWYLPYSKVEARKLLEKELGWRDYGGHHHENIFTKYIIGVWMPQKFGIDKRKVTFSAQVREGHLLRAQALEILSNPPYEMEKMKLDRDYLIKKFQITENEFDAMWKAPNQSFHDIPSYYGLFSHLRRPAAWVLSKVLSYKPMMTYESGSSQ